MKNKYNMTKQRNIFLARRKFEKIECVTERVITIMCYLMRTQFFADGNKRTAMLFVNKIMIENGNGIISIPIEEDINFGKEF